MTVIEICPKCGHDLISSELCVLPPIQVRECPSCGWKWQGRQQEVIRVPFGGMAEMCLIDLRADVRPSPCDLCMYNPPSSTDGKPCSMCPACAIQN